VFLFILLFTVSCAPGKKSADGAANIPTPAVDSENTDESADAPIIATGSRQPDLNQLLRNYTFPAKSADTLTAETEGFGFPLALINEVERAVYLGEADSFIQGINDKSLMVTADDFSFVPNDSIGIDNGEKDLNEYFESKKSDCYFYKCDIDNDGNDEIIMIENLKYDYSWSNTAYLLKKTGDYYVYAGYDFLGYYRCFAICKYENRFFLIANYDDYETKITKAVGLFDLSGKNTSGFLWLNGKKDIYVRKTSDGYSYSPLYQNSISSIVGAVRSYINEIGIDLIYTDREHGTFYGDETYNLMYPTPYTAWNPTGYFLAQNWFKVIDGKTVIFSLYHKNSADSYLLDARMYENGQTTILSDYIISLNQQVALSDYWDYSSDTNYVKIKYNDPDAKKAFPGDLNKQINTFAAQVQGDFISESYEDNSVPNGLIELMEKALFNGSLGSLDLGPASFAISSDDFYNEYGQQLKMSKQIDYYYADSKNEFDRYIRHVYKYELENSTYYLLVFDSGGSARFAINFIYREEAGGLSLTDSLDSLDMNATVIKYDGSPYFIEQSYNYYSKFVDTINIYKLIPGKLENYISIELLPNAFTWKNIYDTGQPYRSAITDYVNGIKDDLMAKSQINDDIQIYVGDETAGFNHDRLLRLKSVGGDKTYYEIDFNNDGVPEYFEKHFWFPSNYTWLFLVNNTYRFSDNRILSIDNYSDPEEATLIQLWFKKIGDQVFTFRLFLDGGYNYSLNVSLIEKTDVTQVQSYIIVPKSKFVVSLQEQRSY